MKSEAVKQFNDIFDKVETEVPYRAGWANGTGYLDHAVSDELLLANGQRWKSVDHSGRRIVGVKTPFGNVVIFARYADEDNGVITSNAPSELRSVVMQGSMTANQIHSCLGYFDFDNNIGKALDLAYCLGKKHANSWNGSTDDLNS